MELYIYTYIYMLHVDSNFRPVGPFFKWASKKFNMWWRGLDAPLGAIMFDLDFQGENLTRMEDGNLIQRHMSHMFKFIKQVGS